MSQRTQCGVGRGGDDESPHYRRFAIPDSSCNRAAAADDSAVTPPQALQQAVAALNAGRLPDAQQFCRAVLATEPQNADALHIYGLTEHLQGRHTEAIEWMEQSLDAAPANAAAYNSLGEANRQAGRFEPALRAYRRALSLSPQFVAPLGNAAIVMLEQGRVDEAVRACEAALRIDPTAVDALNTLGNAHAAAGRHDLAATAFERALAINPNQPTVQNNYAASLETQERFEEAAARYAEAARLNPQFAEAWNNLGNVRQKQMDLPAAEDAFRRSLAANPDFPDATWNLALAALARGDYLAGWPGFLQRFRCAHSARFWREYPGKKLWDGSPLNGRTIVLYGEQGFGDMLQFARFVPHVAALGGRVVLITSPELAPLLKNVAGVAKVTTGEPPENFDFYYPLMSVPGLLGLTIDQVASPPYLAADPARVAAWQERLAPLPGKKVGLVWSGRPLPDPKRSATLADFAPLLALDGITFVSLQKGEAANELTDPTSLAAPWAHKIIDIAPDLHNFADTAAAMAALDHVVTIDTAAAHLAGGVGVPTSVLLTRPPDWRWGIGRSDCEWYSDATLWHQDIRGEWTPVLANIAAKFCMPS